ncbi:hypothetical protein, partial [Bradyrhizobium brasilense]|uniref:hypothetical protein n=1 Tax=Bradyrhizobium brasilense TaxID=1419277 RepID=UPI001E44B911
GMGDCDQRQSEGCGRKQEPRGEAGWDDGRGLHLGVVHLDSLMRGANAPPGGDLLNARAAKWLRVDWAAVAACSRKSQPAVTGRPGFGLVCAARGINHGD